MTYPDSVRFLYSLGNELKVGAKWNLDRMKALTEALGHPECKTQFVHVAGTNGKGSVSAMIASSLRASGLRTGLFTSPHLAEPTERIQLNGQPISHGEFEEAFGIVHTAANRLEAQAIIDAHPSYFETVTAMALLVFSGATAQPCDIAVMEVGLGGRLDATNVIKPGLSVITSISFDHESYLGNTMEAIAGEKAGIIKRGVPVVSMPQLPEVAAVIREKADALRAPLHLSSDLSPGNEQWTRHGCSFEIDGSRHECPLPGRHQLQNALAAIQACRVLGIDDEYTREGLAETRWPGRLEFVASSPDFVLDGAHNPAGAQALAEYIREFCSDRPVWIVYGTMRDKAIDEVIATLFPLADQLILTAPDVPRALRPEAIVSMIDRSDVMICPGVAEAVEAARQAPTDATVFFTGSLFLVGEARDAILRH